MSAASIGGVLATVHHVHTARHYPLALARPVEPPSAALAKVRRQNAGSRLFNRVIHASVFHTNPLSGIASWYGSVLEGHHTASGETFAEHELTAAHRTLPFGTLVRVTDLNTSRSVVVRINDRGVLAPDRVIDLSAAAANELGILRSGLAKVKLEVLQRPHAG